MAIFDDHSVKTSSQDAISKHDYDSGDSSTSSDHQSLIYIADSSARSFEDPFVDPIMEPLPLREAATTANQAHQAHHQAHQSQHQSDSNLGKKMTFFGTNHIVQDAISQHNDDHEGDDDDDDDGSLTSSDHQSLTHVADNVARFRPYQDKKWNGSFQRLLKFKQKFGHCCVPHSYADDPALARWVKRQRHEYKKFEESDPTSTLTTSRLDQLKS
ncbi:MAG: hypothetical protein SGBAC_012313, partial [Bacillariaceae sp.]